MARVLIWNPDAGAFDVVNPAMEESMPYAESLMLSAAAFFGASPNDIAWTDRRALESLDRLCRRFGQPFSVDHAFCRMAAGKPFSMHATGTAFAVGRTLPPEERGRLFRCALESGLFGYVGMPYDGGDTVRLSQMRTLPRLSVGDRGVAVCVLQDALLQKKLYRAALTGTFCLETRRALLRLQAAKGIAQTGVADAAAWAAALH